MRKIKRPKIGQYVLVTKWSDKDPQDPWYVGFITALIITKDAIRYRVDNDLREYKHCWSISEDEGRAWLDAHLTPNETDLPNGCDEHMVRVWMDGTCAACTDPETGKPFI